MKQGYKTSEFYVALVGAVLPIIKEYILPGLPVESMLTIAGIAIAYIASRTVVKAKGGQ